MPPAPPATDPREAPLHARSAADLSAAYAAGALSPLDVVDDVLAHLHRCEPALHATWALDDDGARRAAAASGERWRRGAPLSPLDGVPVTLKENIATRGTPVPLGSAATVLVPADADAPPAARLREAGAVRVARTTMPDWGMLSSGLSSFHALARNPWRTDRNPGGSSAGAAAAAAAGYGPIHLGTDIGGSIRLPAGWCGVVGFKPSLGRIPIHPPYGGRVAGPLARTVRDVAWAMRALARPDWRDAMSLPAQDIDWTDLDLDLHGLRIGLHLDAGWGTPATPAVRAAIEAAAGRLAQAGARVEPLAPFCTRAMADGLDRFWRMRSWLDFRKLTPERQSRVLPYIRAWIARGEALTGTDVFEGYSQMAALRDAAVTATQPFDFVLSPVSPDVAFPANWASPANDPEHPFEHIAFTLPYNMSEQPAISIDAGRDVDGLPIGLQVAGRRHDDLGVLRLAHAWERLRGPGRSWPEGPFEPTDPRG